MGDQRRPRAHAGGRSRRLTAGVAASDNEHVEAGVHLKILQDAGLVANAGLSVKNTSLRYFPGDVSRETSRIEHPMCGR
jgi:hypothetical protein